jgi:hypothetical protein
LGATDGLWDGRHDRRQWDWRRPQRFGGEPVRHVGTIGNLPPLPAVELGQRELAAVHCVLLEGKKGTPAAMQWSRMWRTQLS